MILKHFEEEGKLPISSWHDVFHLVESQLPASLAQEGLCIYQVAEPKKPISDFTRASGNKEGCPGTDSASLVQKENQAKPRKFLLPSYSEVIIDPPETRHVPLCSYSHGFGSKVCKHSRVTNFDCVWHCPGETHGHSTSPQVTSEKCNSALNTHIHRVSLEKSEWM